MHIFMLEDDDDRFKKLKKVLSNSIICRETTYSYAVDLLEKIYAGNLKYDILMLDHDLEYSILPDETGMDLLEYLLTIRKDILDSFKLIVIHSLNIEKSDQMFKLLIDNNYKNVIQHPNCWNRVPDNFNNLTDYYEFLIKNLKKYA